MDPNQNLSTVSKVYPQEEKKERKKNVHVYEPINTDASLRKFSASGQTSWHWHQPNFFVRALINSPTNAHPEDGQNGEEIRVVEFREKTLKGGVGGRSWSSNI